MAKSPEEMIETMKANLLAKTGKSVDDWIGLVRGSGLDRHGDQMKLLKDEHGLTHGFANLVCQLAKADPATTDGDLLDAQFAGKPDIRPVYDALAAYARALGGDVEVSVKKTSVALRRSKNFAMITPATKSRLDVGLNLKGEPGTDRLKAEKPGSMCTHKVGLSSVADLDDEFRAWLADAYSRA